MYMYMPLFRLFGPGCGPHTHDYRTCFIGFPVQTHIFWSLIAVLIIDLTPGAIRSCWGLWTIRGVGLGLWPWRWSFLHTYIYMYYTIILLLCIY